MVDDLAALVHADTFAEQLDQAEVLLASGYKDAAAVVAGVALETHLRILARQGGGSGQVASSPKRKADVVNADLVKSGACSTVQQKAVTAWLGVRNTSAHGESSKFSDGEVRQMITGVADFVGRYPA